MTTRRRSSKLRLWSRKHFTRDMVLRVFGLGGIVYETVTNHAERPTLLILFAAMIGLPQFLGHDEAAPKPKEPEQPAEKPAAEAK